MHNPDNDARHLEEQEIKAEKDALEIAHIAKDQRNSILRDSADWVMAWEDDPAQELANIYHAICLYWDSPMMLGAILKRKMEDKMESVATEIYERRGF